MMNRRDPVRPSLRCRVSAALVAAVFAVGPAFGEILILRDGTRISCRILSRSATEVTIRNAKGSEITYSLVDVERIDDSVSSVEVYEAAAEAVSPDALALAYYVGLWGLEVDPDRKDDSPDLFRMASKNPDWAGRAMYQLHRCAGPGRKSAQYLRQAVALDPTFAEALQEAGSQKSGTAHEIPRAALGHAVEFVDSLISGQYHAAQAALKALEAARDAEGQDMLSSRLFEITGHGLAALSAKCEHAVRRSTRPAPAGQDATQSSGCTACGGVGYLRCNTCEGRGYMPCQACKGQGSVRIRVHHSRKGTRYRYQTCTACRGTGIKDCPVCLRRHQGALTERRNTAIYERCPRCNGAGTIRRTRTTTTYLSGRTYTTEESPCPDCNGSGSIARHQMLDVRITGSGIRRCQRCNADGHIPLPEEARTETAVPLQDASGREVTPAELFEADDLAKLMEFVELARLAAAGKPDYRWRSGGAVRLAPPIVTEAVTPVAFVCGKWMPAHRAELALRRAKALGHTPRPVDIGSFQTWVNDQEMAFLRAHAVPIGLGAKPKDEILDLVAVYQRNHESGYSPALDRVQVFRTRFFPGSPAGHEAMCRWRIGGVVGRVRKLELLLLKQTSTWPGLEVAMHQQPGCVLDLGAVAEAIESTPGLHGQPLTVYYRVRSCTRSVLGQEADASVNVVLEIAPCAALIGQEERPDAFWTEASVELAKRPR